MAIVEYIGPAREGEGRDRDGQSCDELNDTESEEDGIRPKQLFGLFGTLGEKNTREDQPREEGVDSEIICLDGFPARSNGHSLEQESNLQASKVRVRLFP